ncbi:MAG: GIY-YIG nuclease family protein, partial [Candidatus Yanofskybacteria bacterium]|nr:GIY-YIG nuclease family protein [Candidatus Yanofskybacteria bacterium]
MPLNLKTMVRKLPRQPGIYIFKDAKDKPLYVGKASDLKSRLSSYSKIDDPRIKKMLVLASSLKFLKTGSDIEALILESQLIKKLRPRFNIVMRDDKQYFYVGFSNENFPKIFITHQPTKLVYGSQFTVHRPKTVNSKLETSFIGPFTDGDALKTTLRFLRSVFPYCTCQQLHHNYCLNYHIRKCLGFCCLKKPATNDRQLTTYKNNVEAI